MPAARTSRRPRPKLPSLSAGSAPAGLKSRQIKPGNVAFGFAAFNLMFVMFILLLLEIIGTPQLFLSFGMAALVPALIFNAGGIVAFLLLLWLIKGYTEAKWYGIAAGFVLQLCLAIYLSPTSRASSLLILLGVFATVFGVVNRKFAGRENTAPTA